MSSSLILKDSSFVLPHPTGSLESYIQTITAIPILNAEEEKDLAVRLHERVIWMPLEN